MKDKTKFLETILKCPFNDPMDDCAFNRFRKMSITDLIKTIQQMDPTEYDRIMACHNKCLDKRNSNKLAS